MTACAGEHGDPGPPERPNETGVHPLTPGPETVGKGDPDGGLLGESLFHCVCAQKTPRRGRL